MNVDYCSLLAVIDSPVDLLECGNHMERLVWKMRILKCDYTANAVMDMSSSMRIGNRVIQSMARKLMIRALLRYFPRMLPVLLGWVNRCHDAP